METIRRHKRYKAKSPDQTVQHIRDIIQSKLQLGLKEKFFKDAKSMFHSCRIHIDSDGIEELNIGTNGKGVARDYALASAYGEFMERIQNNTMLFFSDFAKPRSFERYKNNCSTLKDYLAERNLSFKYNVAPDERYFTESNEYVDKFIQLGFDDIDVSRLVYLPFYGVSEKEVVYLPHSWMEYSCTSNGMCAGNTPKEAMIQGICEILERYSLQLIYRHNLTPPTIPKELFKGNLIYNYITELENNNWSIEIKDCSCGIGLPAIGILIIDKTNIEYHFHVGSDPSPITALERSLTEIYQGRTEIKFNKFDIDLQYNTGISLEVKEREINKTFVSAVGQFPLSVLSCKDSYEFNGFNTNYGLSDDEDLKLLIGLVQGLGFKPYVRDVSFLGFPAFQIFIPGMSETYHVFAHDESLMKAMNHFFTSHNLATASEADLKGLIGFLEMTKDHFSGLKFVNDKDITNQDYDLMMSVLYLATNDYEKSYEHLSKFILKGHGDNIVFYKCLRDVVYARKIASLKDDSFLHKLYGSAMIDMISRALEKNNIWDIFDTSSCFDCDNCKIAQSCKFIHLLKVSKRMESLYEANVPDQKSVEQYFV